MQKICELFWIMVMAWYSWIYYYSKLLWNSFVQGILYTPEKRLKEKSYINRALVIVRGAGTPEYAAQKSGEGLSLALRWNKKKGADAGQHRPPRLGGRASGERGADIGMKSVSLKLKRQDHFSPAIGLWQFNICFLRTSPSSYHITKNLNVDLRLK